VGGAVALESRTRGAPISVTIDSIVTASGSASVEISLRASYGAIDAHVALLSGISESRVSSVFVFEDPGYFLRFGNLVDVVGLETRLSDYFSELSPPIPVSFVDAAELPTILLSNPHAALVDFAYDTLPDSVFSANTTLLKTWITAGGTLVWAGGPLAFFEGHTLPGGGFEHEDLGWRGQVDLTGYDLEDTDGNPAVLSAGPLLGTNESPIGSALGIEFDGTPDGANTTQLALHNGTDLGFDSASSPEASSRTSLAFVPIGQGRLFYFGGAAWGDGIGTIPNGAGLVSADIGLLLGTGFVPEPGPAVSETVGLTDFHPTELRLNVSGSYTHLIVVVTSTTGAVSLFVWSKQVV
jgi:hypothetical protein